MRLWLSIALLFALAPVHANELDPVEFFGAEHFTAAKGDPLSGTLKLALTGELPAFIDLHSSGDGEFADRFVAAATGLEIRADEKLHRTCEAALDIGVDKLVATLRVISLARGATLAWHLSALDNENARDYLAELRCNADGNFQLQVRVGDGTTFRPLPDATSRLDELQLPAELSLKLIAGKLTVGIAGKELCVTARSTGGVRPGIAVSDGAARVCDLVAVSTFAQLWVDDAARRQAARRALMRLRELAVGGLLQGVWTHDYPATDAVRDAFTRELANAGDVLNQPAAKRANALAQVAAKLPANPMAQHTAGVAALLAGNVAAGLVYLAGADKLKSCALTKLALGEANRRAGNLPAADANLKAAATDLPAALQPDYQLLLARLQAVRGELPAACKTLEAAAANYPDHEALQSYAQSARSLTQPQSLVASARPGPLGLRMLSDLPEKQLATLNSRLQPYLDKFRVWLPTLARQLTGTMVIYTGPEDYLNAALIVASDNLDNVAGMYLPVGIDSKPTVLACRGFGEEELIRTLVHELWHLAYASTAGGKDAPRWLNEGMAVYLSAGYVHNSVLMFDRLPDEFEEGGAKVSAESLKRALEARGLDFYLPGDIRENYTAGWALVFTLMATDDGAADLRKLLAGDAAAFARLRESLKELLPTLADKLAKLQKGG